VKHKVPPEVKRRERHQHEHGRYLIDLNTRKCWMCGQVIPPEPNPNQLSLEAQAQLEMAL